MAKNNSINNKTNSLQINDYSLPLADGKDNQIIKTNGSGTLEWQDFKQPKWRTEQLPSSRNWNSIAYGNGKFVAVAKGGGTTGQIAVSNDGVNWRAYDGADDNDWSDVCYGKGKFVAVASSGTDRAMMSMDGEHWPSKVFNPIPIPSESWTSVAYGMDYFVAVGSSGTGDRVMRSMEGVRWEKTTSAEDNTWTAVAYGNGRFVAVASDGTNRVMTSDDAGATWTARAITAWEFKDITYGNGLFVAVGIDGPFVRSWYSTDGVSWTHSTSSYMSDAVEYGDGIFVAVGGSKSYYSLDGKVWKASDESADKDWKGVSYGNGQWIAIGDGTNNSSDIMVSGNALTATDKDNYLIQHKEDYKMTIGMSGNQTLASGSSHLIKFDTIIKGSMLSWDRANPNYRLVAIEPGTYEFHIQHYVTGNTLSHLLGYLKVNGADEYRYSGSWDCAHEILQSGSVRLELSRGDTVQAYIHSSGTRGLGAGSTKIYIQYTGRHTSLI